VVLGDRRKIMRAIARLDSAPEAAVLEPEALSTLSAAALQGSSIKEKASERGDVTLNEIVRDAATGHPRANYHELIAGAVKALDRSTAEARQLIYDRARKALIAHLRCNQPGLSEVVIAKERLALEDAIRRIEAAARKARTEIPTEPQPAFPGGMPRWSAASEPPRNGWPAELPDGRKQPLSSQSSMEGEAVSGFREVVRELQHDFGGVIPTPTQTVPRTPEAYEEKAIEFIVNPHDFIGQELTRGDAYGREDKQVSSVTLD
jgi:hypothetical protein